MKTVLLCLIVFCAIAMPALGELTDADLDKIRLIVREEIKAEITASEKRMKEYIDLKLENVSTEFKRVDSRVDDQIKRVDDQVETTDTQIGYLRTQINLFVGIPLGLITLLFAWRALRDKATDKKISAVMADLESRRSQPTEAS